MMRAAGCFFFIRRAAGEPALAAFPQSLRATSVVTSTRIQCPVDSRRTENCVLKVGAVLVQTASGEQAVRKQAAEDHLITFQHLVVEHPLKKFVAQGPGAEGDHNHFRALFFG